MATALVADPSTAARHAAAEMLESLGFQVVTAAAATETLLQTAELGPDLVLVDARLETADGALAIAAIRQISDACLIHLSADGRSSEVRGAMAAGADDYLVKPFDVSLLRFKLAQARTRRRLQPAKLRLVQDNTPVVAPRQGFQLFGRAG